MTRAPLPHPTATRRPPTPQPPHSVPTPTPSSLPARLARSRLGLLLLAAGLTACRPTASTRLPTPEPTPGHGVLATVGSRVIRSEHLDLELERRRQLGDHPDRSAVLQDLIQRESLLAYALELGLDRDPSVIRASEDLLIAHLKDRELQALSAAPPTPNTSPSPRRTTTPKPHPPSQIRFAVLRQQTHSRMSSQRRDEARQRLIAAHDHSPNLPPHTQGFGQLALEFSDDDATRFQGGDMGWMPEDSARLRHEPAVLRAAFALRNPGDLSPIVEGRDGLYLVRLVGRRPAPTLTPVPNSTDLDDHLAPPARNARQQAELALLERVRTHIPIRLATP